MQYDALAFSSDLRFTSTCIFDYSLGFNDFHAREPNLQDNAQEKSLIFRLMTIFFPLFNLWLSWRMGALCM